MIKFIESNASKDYVLNLIAEEEINVRVIRVFQENLKKQIIEFSSSFINNSYLDVDDPDLPLVSDFLGDTGKMLKRVSSTLDQCEELEGNIASLKDFVVSQSKFQTSTTKFKIDEYNKKYTAINKSISAKNTEIQSIFAECQKSTIYTKLLAQRNAMEEIEDNEPEEVAPSVESIEKASESAELVSEPVIETQKIDKVKDEETESILDQFAATPMVEFDGEKTVTISKDSEKEKKKGFKLKKEKTNKDEKIDKTEKNKKTETKKKEVSIDQETDLPKIVENTLIVSEKNSTVILPYTVKELDEKLHGDPDKYENIEDVIEQDYTVPLQYYKNSSIARFKEAFKLVRNRNNGSLKHALDLAFELVFCYNLHPAIISACKTVDDLDVYLSCLEYDELEDFKIFKIIFDVLPKMSKKDKAALKTN